MRTEYDELSDVQYFLDYLVYLNPKQIIFECISLPIAPTTTALATPTPAGDRDATAVPPHRPPPSPRSLPARSPPAPAIRWDDPSSGSPDPRPSPAATSPTPPGPAVPAPPTASTPAAPTSPG